MFQQYFPEGVEGLTDSQFAELLEQLPPFVQQALYALQGGNALPLPLPGLPDEEAATSDEEPERVVDLANPDAYAGPAASVSSVSASLELETDNDAPAWLQVLRPLQGRQEVAAGAVADPRGALSMAALDSSQESSPPPSGELSALLQRTLKGDKLALDADFKPTEGLSTAAPVETNVVPIANGYAVQTREVQPGGQQQLVTEITQTVGTARWGEAVMDKVMWLSSQNVQSAQIRLDPPDLGPLEVKININSDQASVVFTSNHVQVRDALEQQLARLREMFDQQGMQLVNVDVSDQNLAQQNQREAQDPDALAAESSSGMGSDGEEQAEGELQVTAVKGLGLVDYYA
ncbi:flagellar hook-length control protein FliK [Aestuariirhabdus litorea]|nr:flagellar hook-length control protein FliK [Aestuariirhabdus litorea]